MLRARAFLVVAAACLAGSGVAPADARIVRFEIVRSETPALGGATFGAAGTYDRLVGRAYGEVDPVDPKNGSIEDIHRAARNSRGLVEYAADVEILVPHDPQRGNGTLLFDAPNRGNPMALGIFDIGGSFADTAAIGDGFLLRQGYTIVWAAWQGDVLPGGGRLTMQVPVAQRHRGVELTGRVRSELIVSAPAPTLNLSAGAFTGASHASYEPVDPSGGGATLTRRVHEADAAEEIAPSRWAFADCDAKAFPGVPSTTRICIDGGFDPNYIYELTYTARQPRVLGLGFASTRDLLAFLRYRDHDDDGRPNPLAHAVGHLLMHGTSQSGRFLRSFVQLGFNQAEDGRIVADGINAHLASQSIALNVRFGQPGRAYGQHEDHRYPAAEAPFTWDSSYDPISMREGGLLDRCRATGTCPKIVQTVSSTEYWQGRMSLDTTDVHATRDVAPPRDVRIYLFAGTQHVPARGAPAAGICQQLPNPNPYVHAMRALLGALRDWVDRGVEPPASRIPTLQDGSLVASSAAGLGWPPIPGVQFTGLKNELTELDFGPHFRAFDESGAIAEPAVERRGRDYAVRVPRVDADGNEIAGVRSVALQAPLGTYTGWNLRRTGFADGDLCGLTGSFIPFRADKAERLAAHDPRPSLQERYGDHAGYVAAVKAAADRLVADRLLLADDAAELVMRAQASDVLRAPLAAEPAASPSHGGRHAPVSGAATRGAESR